MRKIIVLLLTLLLALAFVGCGGEKAEAPAPTAAPVVTAAPETTAAPEATATPEPVEVSSPELPEVDPVQEAVETALALKDHPVDELYAALGEPLSSEYASSCLVMGGKDGILSYDGFTVYTLVDANGNETVYDAE